MAITFTQAAVDAAVNYLMTGGPNGGELTRDQYAHMIHGIYNDWPHLRAGIRSILTDFAWQIQLAINQGHSGMASSRNICRDSWGAPKDAYASGYIIPATGPHQELYGFAQNEVTQLGVSISG